MTVRPYEPRDPMVLSSVMRGRDPLSRSASEPGRRRNLRVAATTRGADGDGWIPSGGISVAIADLLLVKGRQGLVLQD